MDKKRTNIYTGYINENCLDKENVKNEFNNWIKKNNCIDFEGEIGSLVGDSYRFNDLCDSGDHLHPSKHAYDLMGRLAAKIVGDKNEN